MRHLSTTMLAATVFAALAATPSIAAPFSNTPRPVQVSVQSTDIQTVHYGRRFGGPRYYSTPYFAYYSSPRYCRHNGY